MDKNLYCSPFSQPPHKPVLWFLPQSQNAQLEYTPGLRNDRTQRGYDTCPEPTQPGEVRGVGLPDPTWGPRAPHTVSNSNRRVRVPRALLHRPLLSSVSLGHDHMGERCLGFSVPLDRLTS